MKLFLKDIIKQFNKANTLTKLIYINIGIFIILQFSFVFSFLFNIEELQISSLLALPADIVNLKKCPWTIITYMFIHQSILHLIFNILWLFFSGKIFLSLFSNKQLISTYILGGISGAILFILSFNIFPVFEHNINNSYAIGASASVLAIIMAIATKSPNYEISLFIFGKIKLKHIAIASILIDILSIPNGNAGGHIAHLGGAFYGFIYVRQYESGNDISSGFNNLIDYIYCQLIKRSKIKKIYSKDNSEESYLKRKLDDQARIDKILDKIAKSGYDGLTSKEKDILFKASKK